MSSGDDFENLAHGASLVALRGSEQPASISGSDSESDSEPIPPTAGEALQPTRKVIDNLQFSQFLRDHQEKIYSSVPSSSIRDQDKSMNFLVREAESERIITSPREYQTELFEKAKEQNIIAVLDTGASL